MNTGEALEISVIDSFNLKYVISGREYKYDCITDGEVRAVFPNSILDDLYKELVIQPKAIFPPFGNISNERVAGIFLGFSAIVPDDDKILENIYTDYIKISGVPRNGVIRLSKNLSMEELKEFVKSKDELKLSQGYEIKNISSQLLPIILEPNLHRDAAGILSRNDPERRYLEGMSGIEFNLRVGEYLRKMVPNFRINQFSIKLGETFPSIKVLQPKGYRYDPINKTMNWTDVDVGINGVSFAIVGPYKDIIGTNMLDCKAEMTIEKTISGVHIDKIFDLDGFQYEGDINLRHQTEIAVDIRLEPATLMKETVKYIGATMKFSLPPLKIYESLAECMTTLGAPPLDRMFANQLREICLPAVGKQGVFKMEAAKIQTKKEYDDGVVYLDATVNGEFTSIAVVHDLTNKAGEISKESSGSKETGSSVVKLDARSASLELAQRFIDELQKAIQHNLKGG